MVDFIRRFLNLKVIALLVSLLALFVSVYTFHYTQVEERVDLWATVSPRMKGGTAGSYHLELTIANPGNRPAVVSSVALLLRDPVHGGDQTLEWNPNQPVVMLPGSVHTGLFTFGDSLAYRWRKSYPDSTDVPLWIKIVTIDNHGLVSVREDSLGLSFFDDGSLVTGFLPGLPARYQLLPSTNHLEPRTLWSNYWLPDTTTITVRFIDETGRPDISTRPRDQPK